MYLWYKISYNSKNKICQMFEIPLFYRHIYGAYLKVSTQMDDNTTNIDLLKIRPVKTNKVLKVSVGDLPLEPRE